MNEFFSFNFKNICLWLKTAKKEPKALFDANNNKLYDANGNRLYCR